MANRSLGVLSVDLVARIGGFEEGMDKAGRSLDKKSRELNRRAKQLGADLGLALSAGIGAAATAMGVYIKNTIEAEKVQAQLASRIKDTGGIAGRTLADLNAQADKLQNLTIFDDEAIGGVQAMLLTFKNIQGVNFDDATASVLDLSTAMGTDLNSAALQLGKALNDPVKGLSALGRAGVQFSEDQQKAIKAMVEAGDVAGAQRVILKELEGQMGTAAEAARNTLGGAFQGLKNTVDNLLEGDASSGGMSGLVEAVNNLNASLQDPGLKRGIDSLAEGILAAANAAIQGAAKLGDFIAQYKQFLADRGFIAGKEIDQLEKRRDKLVEFKGTLSGKLLFNSSDIDKEITEVDNRIEQLKHDAVWGNVLGGVGSTYDPKAAAVPGSTGGGSARSASKAKSDAAKAAREAEGAIKALTEADADLYAASLQVVDAQSQAMVQWTDLTAELDGPLKVAEVDHIHRLQEIEETGKAAGATAEQIADAKAKETAAYNATTEAIKAQQEAMQNEDLIRGMDNARAVAYDFLMDLPRKGKGAWQDFLDNLTDMLDRWAAKGIVDQLFGPQGTTGQGTTGGGWLSSLIGAFAGSGSSQGSLIDLFSGGWGFADGGTMAANSFARVNERGFEMATVGGNDYLLTGNRPVKITSHERLGGGGVTQNVTFNVQGVIDRRTKDQIANDMLKQGVRANQRN
ncbi:MAG TPA: hypothetical protein VM619_10730 [Luteimonas sp.]|nr:hypothetical protein [Luteimonas sp.]